jgi:hypothetical protein
MGELSVFIKTIGATATSPLALIAYLATIIAWTLIAWRMKRFEVLMAQIHQLPEKDRLNAVREEFGNIRLKEGLSAEQYLRFKKSQFILFGFLAICGVVILVLGLSTFNYFTNKQRADNLITKILGSVTDGDMPSSQFQSSVNVLSNGPVMIHELVAAIGPAIPDDQLADITWKLQQQGMNAEQIARELGNMAGTGQVTQANDSLQGAADSVNNELAQITDCYRNLECGQGAEFDKFCGVVSSINQNISQMNEVARAIPGVNFNESDAPLMLGNGTMDLSFNMIRAKNVSSLARICSEN